MKKLSIASRWKRFKFYLSHDKGFINLHLDSSVGRKEFILFLLNKKYFLKRYLGPLVIEYNFAPGTAVCQLAHGPMFSKDDLDEIMEQVSKA